MNECKKVLQLFKIQLLANTESQPQKAIKSFQVDVRSSRPEEFCKKGVLEILQNSQENTCGRNIFNKVTGLSLTILFKKSLLHRCFPENFANFLRTQFFSEHLRWLLVNLLFRYSLRTSQRFSDVFRGHRNRTNRLKWIDPLSANPTKLSDTLKQFVSFWRQIV